MLYQPEAFEPLKVERRDEGRVRDVIAEIVADTDVAFSTQV